MTPAVVSKGEFAAIARVSPTRVGQWLREGKITADALEGEGRFARIKVDIACEQLKLRRDVGQSLGNGLETRLDFDTPSSRANGVREPETPRDDLNAGIRRERLRALEFQNRGLAEAELARRGRYVGAEAVRAALGKVATDMVGIFEGSLPDLASAIAGQFAIPQRDVLHLLRTEFRSVRTNAAKALAAGAERLPTLVADDVAEDEAAPLEAD